MQHTFAIVDYNKAMPRPWHVQIVTAKMIPTGWGIVRYHETASFHNRKEKDAYITRKRVPVSHL